MNPEAEGITDVRMTPRPSDQKRPVRRPAPRAAPLSAAERTARLLSLIPWVAARDGASIDELESRFDYPRGLLLQDLTTVTIEEEFLDEIPPDSPFSHIVDIDWDPAEDRISVACPSWLYDPMRLNGDEAARLLAAGQAALRADGGPHGRETLPPGAAEQEADGVGDAQPAPSALLRALTKLQLMLDDGRRGLNTRAEYIDHADRSRSGRSRGGQPGIDIGLGLDVCLEDAPESMLEDLQRAVAQRERVEIEYYSYARDELTARAVDPAAVFNRGGAWYFTGWCHSASAERVFRLDRIRSMRAADAGTAVDGSSAAAELPSLKLPSFDPRGCDREVTLRLDRRARWAEECCLVRERREIDGGLLEIDLEVSALPWLARLLLQLGPHAEVVTDDPEVAGLRSSAAASVLARYR